MRESGEMYLETILILESEKNAVRSIDVAERMGFSKPSVSRAIGKLKADGNLLVDANGYISLLPEGQSGGSGPTPSLAPTPQPHWWGFSGYRPHGASSSWDRWQPWKSFTGLMRPRRF